MPFAQKLIFLHPVLLNSVLAWVSIYLFSAEGPATSVRIYYETNTKGNFEEVNRGECWSPIPMGLSYFPAELRIPPKTYVNLNHHMI